MHIGMGKGPHNNDAQSSCLCPYTRRGFTCKAVLHAKHFRSRFRCFLASESCPIALLPVKWNRIPWQGVSLQSTTTGEAGVKSELQRVRALAEARIKSGNVPDWSWSQHVQLIEAVDAMLHDLSVSETAVQAKRYTGSPLRLVTVNPTKSDVRRKTGSMH